jgi:hypothetical protein
MAVPDGASCYLCLDEGPDEEGKSLVRDCSCRGDSAGFAHLSCIVNYAEQKCKQMAAEANFSVDFVKPWKNCLNCKQTYQRQLSLDITSAFVAFVEATYGRPENSKWDKIRVIQSLLSKITNLMNNTLRPFSRQDKGMLTMECKTVTKKLLSMVEQMKKDEKMDGWIHMPQTSLEYKLCKIIRYFEACGYESLGQLSALDDTEESNKIAIKHLEKARIIYNLFGMKDEAQGKRTERKIAVITARSAWSNEIDTNVRTTALLENARINYESHVESSRLTSVETIISGLCYAQILRKANCGIEAERLLMKLAPDSRLVHGPEHDCTTRAEEMLEQCKKRNAVALPDGKPSHTKKIKER